MKLFFGEIIPDVKINDEEQQHIVKVLRMKEGEEIFVTDGKGNLAKGNLVFEGKKVSLNVTEVQEYFPIVPELLQVYTKHLDRFAYL